MGKVSVRRYEEFAYVLDYIPIGRSSAIKGREGPILQVLGEGSLTLLETLADTRFMFNAGEKVSLVKESRTKIQSVLGKVKYKDLTRKARESLPKVVARVIRSHPRYAVLHNAHIKTIELATRITLREIKQGNVKHIDGNSMLKTIQWRRYMRSRIWEGKAYQISKGSSKYIQRS